MAVPPPSPLQQVPLSEIEGIDEATWLDVIQKMDEVYSKLVSDEIELEEKNAQLEQSQQFIFSLLSAMSDVLIACNQDGVIEETNAALCELVGRSEDALRGSPVLDLLADEQSVQRWQLAMYHTQTRAGVVVEIKSLLDRRAIEQMRRTMDSLFDWLPEHRDKEFMGMVAYVDGQQDVREAVLAEGWHLVQVGDDLFKVETPPGFRPRIYRAAA